MKLDEIKISRAIIEAYNEKLIKALDVDVAIAGAGPSGMVCGYYLAKAGKRVVLFERKLSVGGGMWGGGIMFNEIVVQEEAKKILDDAKALEKAGAFAILLEMVPDRLCKLITERAEGCIIMSLGSGPDAHGQLLIYHDMFGLYPKFKPKMAKVYGNAGEVILKGLKSYHDEVVGKQFPQPENWFGMPDEEFDELKKMLG